MSPRHATPRPALKRNHLVAALLSTATAGAAAITLISTGLAPSAQSHVGSSTAALVADTMAAPSRAHSAQHPSQAHSAEHPSRVHSAPEQSASQVPVPSTGNKAKAQVMGGHLNVRAVAEPAIPAKAEKKMPSAADALKLAVSQVGTTESASGGSKFNQWFMSSPYAQRGIARDGGSIGDYANASWCDMFVTWVGDQAGVKGMGGDAFTPAHAQWFQEQGRWGNVPKPGAVVFYSWSGGKSTDSIDHVGLVIKDNHDGTIQTVEGNTDNAVKVRTRSTSTVVGYGYPEYAQ